jgi:hypothetical protein
MGPQGLSRSPSVTDELTLQAVVNILLAEEQVPTGSPWPQAKTAPLLLAFDLARQPGLLVVHDLGSLCQRDILVF